MSQTSNPTNETVIVSDTQSLLNVNMTNVTKLTTSNFIMWQRQVHTLFDGYDLTGYLDGFVTAPPTTVTTATGSSVNPAYNYGNAKIV